jgi:hypothetical protein
MIKVSAFEKKKKVPSKNTDFRFFSTFFRGHKKKKNSPDYEKVMISSCITTFRDSFDTFDLFFLKSNIN